MNKKVLREQMLNKTRQLFLLSFFQPNNLYEEKEINGFWLIKQFDNQQNKWQVAIYAKDAYFKRRNHNLRMKYLIATRRNNASENK